MHVSREKYSVRQTCVVVYVRVETALDGLPRVSKLIYKSTLSLNYLPLHCSCKGQRQLHDMASSSLWRFIPIEIADPPPSVSRCIYLRGAAVTVAT
jgi:hypothetical protein